MKKVLVAAILGLAAVSSVKAQGSIVLYNYNTGKLINYGVGSGGTVGNAVASGSPYTVGFYFVSGDQTATINSAFATDTTANGTVGGIGGLALFSGANGTSAIGTDLAGYFSATSAAANLGVAGGSTVTLVIVAYNGASYSAASVRGHSAAFTMTAKASPSQPDLVGIGNWSSFAVTQVPEPSTFALAGLGLAGLLIFRRRN